MTPWVIKVNGRVWARAASLREVTQIVNALVPVEDRPRITVTRGLEVDA